MPDPREAIIEAARAATRRQEIIEAARAATQAADLVAAEPPGVDEYADEPVEPTRPPRELVLPTMEIRQGEEGRFADEPALDIVRDEEGTTVRPIREGSDQPSSVGLRYRPPPTDVAPAHFWQPRDLAPERVITGRQYSDPADSWPTSSAAGRIAADTASLGWADEAEALTRSVMLQGASPWSVLFGEDRPVYERELRAARDRQLSAEEQATPTDVVAGRVAGTLPMLLAPGGAAAAGGRAALAAAPRAIAGGRMALNTPRLLRMAGGALEGGAIGAAAGAGYAEDGRLSGALEGGAIGAGLGGGLAGGAGALRDRVGSLLQRPPVQNAVGRMEQMAPGLRTGADVRELRSIVGPNVTGQQMRGIVGVRRGRAEHVGDVVATVRKNRITNADDLARVEEESGRTIGETAERIDNIAAANRAELAPEEAAEGMVDAASVADDLNDLARRVAGPRQNPEAAQAIRTEAAHWRGLVRRRPAPPTPTPEPPPTILDARGRPIERPPPPPPPPPKPPTAADREIPLSVAWARRRAIGDRAHWDPMSNGRLAPASEFQAEIYGIVANHLQRAADATDPLTGAAWRTANRTYSHVTGLARLADKAALSRAGNRQLTLTNTLGMGAGAGAGGAIAGIPGAVAGAVVGAGVNALARRLEHSVAAGGRRRLADIFENLRPAAAGAARRYDAATARVPRTAAAAHFQRSQTDPLYRINQLLTDEIADENENEEIEQWESEPSQ